ncbi:MAG: UDP-3-O-[3-hydroxymyristoyl] N-acetylglucosamine deacetylase [Deltaproteobacteria bacterium]|nr:UDP-3-O-[3-hydroxymyristoyl] N-acetylglucosamine deacetylase [Deltaproteobacteria bacterium]
MILTQRTIQKSISLSGKGLHSGKVVKVYLHPAHTDSGIVFKRTDIKNAPLIPARSEYVVDTTMATTLGKKGISIATVEHLLSAIAGLQIDNIRIEVEGPEIPIMDGSAHPFFEALHNAGLKEQKELKKFLVITKPVAVRNQDRFCYLFPSKQFKITCRIEFPQKCIGKQRFEVSFPLFSKKESNACDHSHGYKNGNGKAKNGNGQSHFADISEIFFEEISRARTFGFLEEVEMLQRKGLALGGGLENAVVIDKDTILNKEGLRWQDEFVRHKVLDAMGDLSLLGMQIIGHLVTYRSGHSLHHKLVERTLKNNSNWKIMTFEETTSGEEEFFLSRSLSQVRAFL